MMKRITTALFAAALAASAIGAAREISFSADISRPSPPQFSWGWTESLDMSVRVSVLRGGAEYPVATWEPRLVLGDGVSGFVVEGRKTGYSEIVFDIPADAMPTNGRYAVQLISTCGTRSEEWARGTMRVNANPAMNYMPSCWLGYERIARRAAMYIDFGDFLAYASNAIALTNYVAKIAASDPIAPSVSSVTNPCLTVLLSASPFFPVGLPFVWDRTNGTERVYRNNLLEEVVFSTTNTLMDGVFTVSIQSGVIATYTSTNRNGVLYFTASPTNLVDYVAVSTNPVPDSTWNGAMYPTGGQAQ